jgi:hypothetical protein
MRRGFAFAIGAFFGFTFLAYLVFSAFGSEPPGIFLWIGIVVAIAAYFYGQSQSDRDKAVLYSPGGWNTLVPVDRAFAQIQDLVATSYLGSDWWQLRVANEAAGQIVGVLQFSEFYGQKLGNLERQIVLNARVSPAGSGTHVQLNWQVMSPLNSDTCDSIVSQMTSTLRQRLPG